jgi:hypothetical protein
MEKCRATFEVILLFLNPRANDFQIGQRRDKIEFKKVLIMAFAQKILFEGVKR